MECREAKRFFKSHGVKINSSCKVNIRKFLKNGNSEDEINIDLKEMTCEIKGYDCLEELEVFMSGKHIDCSGE